MTTTPTSLTPTENAQGRQVWKPSVGIVFEPDSNLHHSYGGIIAALKDGTARNGGIPKSYPHNFAGIISAIHDLEASELQIPVHPGPIPPGTEIDINTGDLIVIVPPKNGSLWFDTRQGRLFIALDDEWWQTNGADGLAYIREKTNPPPVGEVAPGQFWFEPYDLDLYVFDGVQWVLVVDNDGLQTTGTLPLEYAVNQYPFGEPPEGTGYGLGWDPSLAPINIDDPLSRPRMLTQEDFNVWLLDSIWDLDQATKNYVHNISFEPQAPVNPEVGDLWFDPTDVSMSIYYDDGNTKQWVPVHSGYDTALAFRAIDEKLDEQIDATSVALVNLELAQATIQEKLVPLQGIVDAVTALQNASIEDDDAFEDLRNDLFALYDEQHTRVTGLMESDATMQSEINELATLLNSNTSLLMQLMSKDTADAATTQAAIDAINATNAAQQTQINDCISVDLLDAAVADIESREPLYALKSGGRFTGGLTIDNADLSAAALDLSGSVASSTNALKLKTFGGHTATFGATEESHQLAYNITGHQELAVVHDNAKQLSVTSDGLYSRGIKIADFVGNDGTGMRAVNIIDVKERLIKYQTAFEEIRSSLVLNETFDEFKVSLAQILSRV